MTIQAVHTPYFVRVLDPEKGFFDCESFIWCVFVALVSPVFTEDVYCCSKSVQNITFVMGFNDALQGF